MYLTPDDYHILLDDAVNAAARAAQVIGRFQHKTLDVKRKAGASLASTVVTEVDLLSQQVIIETLQNTIDRYDLALLAEECADDGSRFEKDFFWCIDPLDGTLPFIEQTPGYAVVISLISKQGVPQLGVICDGVTGTCYTALQNEGCFRDGKPWKLDVADSFVGKTLSAVFDRSTMEAAYFPSVRVVLQEVACELGFVGVDVLNYGGAAMNAMYILDHAPGCYFKLPRKSNSGGSIWDYGASASIFAEWGGQATDIFGDSLDLNRSDSTFLSHRGLLFVTHRKLREALFPRLHSLF